MISCLFKTTKPKCSECSGVTGCHLPLVLMYEITVQERKIITTTQPPWVKCQPTSLMPKQSQKERIRMKGEQREKTRGSEERKSSLEMEKQVIWWTPLLKKIVVFDYKRLKSEEDLGVCVLLLHWGFWYRETYCFKPTAHLLATMQTLC